MNSSATVRDYDRRWSGDYGRSNWELDPREFVPRVSTTQPHLTNYGLYKMPIQ